MELQSNDFAPLEAFPLIWRWTDARHAEFSEQHLRRIQPLSEESAAKLAANLDALHEAIHSGSIRLGDVLGHPVQDPLVTSAWLDSLIDAPPVVPILISWSPQAAVLTDWPLFAELWEDFYYPSSDDVSIIPQEGDWLLTYHHSEHFAFGRPRAV